jgi:hypothetical protein
LSLPGRAARAAWPWEGVEIRTGALG